MPKSTNKASKIIREHSKSFYKKKNNEKWQNSVNEILEMNFKPKKGLFGGVSKKAIKKCEQEKTELKIDSYPVYLSVG